MSDHVVVGQQGDVPLPVQATFTAEVPGPAFYRYVRVVKTVSEYFFIGELRVLADPHGKIAALSFGLHGDGSLAPIDPAHHDRLLLEHNQEVELPANSLDRLETCRDHIREAPPLVTRSGLVFDGGEQIIDTRDAPALADTSFTVELWARCRRLGNTEVFLGQGVSGVDSALHLGFRGGGFFFAFGANDLDAPLGQDREWHHWACVSHQGGLRQIFRDGVKVAEDTPARPFKGTGRLWLGGAFGYGYDGELADVRVWRRARTAAEINETMNHRLTGRELGLVAHWPLDAIVDRQVFNTVGQVPGVVKGGVYRTGRALARTLADGYNLVDRYSNPALVPVAERATYIESFELKSASEGPPFDIVFWGETVRGERTAPVGVPAQFERLPDGWVRVTARFTTPQGMTRLRTLEFTPPGGTWNPLEIRNHRLARLHGTVTESSHAEAAALTELAPEFAALLKVEQTLGALESQEVELARKLSPIDKSLAGGVQGLQTLVAQNQEKADKAESRVRQLEMELRHLEGHIGKFSTIALHTSHSTLSGYLRVDGTEVDARATEPGPWEEFTLLSFDRPCVHYGDNVGLLAHSARYLSPIGVDVTTMDSPYLNWWIFNPDNDDDLGPIPVGAKVALMGHGGCLTYDADSTSHTHGAVWCGGAPEWEHTRFRVEQTLEGPEVAAARERHDDARDELDRCNRELAFAREVLANYQNLSIMRDDLQAQLVALQGQISAAITEHLAATQAIDDATMSMPQLSPPARPLTVQGALLGFARTHASPTAIDSLEGAVHLYFAGTEGRLRRCTYDALGQRWRADTLGACLRFRGQGDHVEIPHRAAFTARAFTIELWARWRGDGTDTHFLTARGFEELEIHTGDAVPDGLRFIPVPGVLIDSEPGVLRRGEWFHVACVYAGHASTAEIYLNGKLVTLRRSGGEATMQPTDRPLRLGLRGDGHFPLAGEMAEVRLWNVVLTRDEIAAHMHFRLSGHEPGLVGYWPLREGAGAVARDMCARGAPANIKDGSIKGPTWYPSTAPIGRPKAGLPTISGAPLAGEYSTLEGKEGQKEALLRRFIAWPREGGAEVLHGQRVDTLELRWLGNVQMKPTLVGYIEGAPPVPSENLTIKNDYNGASSVEFKVTDDSSSTFTHDVVTEFGDSVEQSFGMNWSGTSMAIDWLMRAVVKLQASVGGHVVHQNSSTNSASMITSERLALKGEREEVARLPQIGRRFIPKNVGYASVVSTLADMFVMRMRGNKRMVGFQISEVEGVPPDVNVITFMLNPAYTMNGSLDGQVGTSAADPRFYGHIPEARGQHGASVPASYYRLAEAYDLKRAIDRANSGAAAVAINRKSDLITPTGQANDTAKETKLADVVGRTPMRSIANTYVWDGDGGLRVESQSFATEWTNVIGGGWSFGAGVGSELKVTAGVTYELSEMASFSIRHTMTTTNVGSRAIELNVTVDGENQGITDNRDRPLVPGEKVDRYRFMSFALEPATAHFDDFFARVVDPEWLAGNSAEAYALRQIDRSKKNATWRVLHRVTYVERPK